MTQKNLTYTEARDRLMNYCSRYETCTRKALQKLQQWQIPQDEQQGILQYLTEHKFIDDERYAQNFVRGKSAGSKWGTQKIRVHLQQQGIDAEIIAQALQTIDANSETATLEGLLRKKIQHTKAESDALLMAKLLRFAISRGFGYTVASEVAKRIVGSNKDIDGE